MQQRAHLEQKRIRTFAEARDRADLMREAISMQSEVIRALRKHETELMREAISMQSEAIITIITGPSEHTMPRYRCNHSRSFAVESNQ